LVQKRAQEELEKATAITQAKAEAGKKGAQKRWQSDGTHNGKRMAEPSNSHRQTDAPLPSPEPEQTTITPACAGFDDFWEAFPKKESRGRAERAWSRAITLADPATIIAAARVYAMQRVGQDEKYTRIPATWLDDKCWMDEGVTTPALSPEQLAANKDRADRLMKRGKYDPMREMQ
jgi:hypothetical protein